MKYDDELEHALEMLDATCDYHTSKEFEAWHYCDDKWPSWRIKVIYTPKGWIIVDHSHRHNLSIGTILARVDTAWEMLEELAKHPKVLARLARPMEAK